MKSCFYILIVWSSGALAETVLFSTPDASRVEYRAMVEADPDIQTPVEAWRAQTSKSATRREFHEALVKHFERGQKAYLNFNLEDARREFSALAESARLEDLTRAEREIVVTTMLRLAQIEGESPSSNAWLLRSLNFLADVTIDRKIFPPPLLARLQKLRLDTKRSRPHAIGNDPDWSMILVNGRACTSRDCPEFFVTVDPVRFTYLSERWLPQTVVAPLETADEFVPKKIPWVTGACAHPSFHSRARALGPARAFWNLACETSTTDHSPVLATAAPLDLKPTEAASLSPSRDLPGLSGDATPVTNVPAPSRGGWFRSKWFWLGLGGAAITGIVLASQSHPREHIEATARD